MISLTAGSIPVMSYAKTITRLAAYARLPDWFSPRPAAATVALTHCPSRPSTIA